MNTEESDRTDVEVRQDSPRRRKHLRAVIGAALVGIGVFLLYLLLTEGSAILVGSVLMLGAATVTGVILERIDSSRQADHEGHPEDYWGFHGRPGS